MAASTWRSRSRRRSATSHRRRSRVRRSPSATPDCGVLAAPRTPPGERRPSRAVRGRRRRATSGRPADRTTRPASRHAAALAPKPHQQRAAALERTQLDMRLTERTRQVVDLLGHPRFAAGRLARPLAVLEPLTASCQELVFPVPDRRLSRHRDDAPPRPASSPPTGPTARPSASHRQGASTHAPYQQSSIPTPRPQKTSVQSGAAGHRAD
jgi:hypothetical protein